MNNLSSLTLSSRLNPAYKDLHFLSCSEFLLSTTQQPLDFDDIQKQFANVDSSFQTQNAELLEESLNNLNYILTNSQITQDVRKLFAHYSMAEHLLFIVLNEDVFSPPIIQQSISLMRRFIDSGDFYPQIDNNFYQFSFDNAGIIELFKNKIHIANNDNINAYLHLLISMCYLNAPFTTKFLNECSYQISEFINEFQFNQTLPPKKREKLFKLITNTIYLLSFSINCENFNFFYIFIDSFFHIDSNCYKNKFMMYIIYNICKIESGVELVSGNEFIISKINEILISNNIDLIKPSLRIIMYFIEKMLPLNEKFYIINFLILIEINDDEIRGMALEIINSCMRNPEMVEQLFLNKTSIMSHIHEPFKDISFTTKMKLALALCSIVHEAGIDSLFQLVKDHLTFYMVDFLSFDDDDIVIPVLKSLTKIFSLPKIPVDEGNSNLIPISDFYQADGLDVINNLNYDNEEIFNISNEFLDLFEKINDQIEENGE